MPNEKRRKSVDEIIAKYGVQSISTEAANDILFDEEFARTIRPAAEPKDTPPPFREEAPAREIEDLRKAEQEEQVKETPRRTSHYTLPENYQAKSAYDEEEADGEEGDFSFLSSDDDYVIPNSAYYTQPMGDKYSGRGLREDMDFDMQEDGEEVPSANYGGHDERPNWFIRFLRFFIPWKGDGIGEIIRKIIFLVALVSLIVSASILVPAWYEDWKAGQTDNQVSALYRDGSDEEKIKQAEAILGKSLPAGILPEFALLYANNQDIAGWVTIPDTLVDYPIAKAQDNKFYLTHDYYKNNTRYGVPFMDYDCGIQPMGDNTVIYGHHMNNGTVFSGLDAYRTVEGYQKHPVINFNTIYERRQWKVIGAFLTNSDPADDNGYQFDYRVKSFVDEADFNGYLQGVKERSLFTTNVDVTYGDKLLTLQTCAHDFHEARLIVVARMVRDGEDAAVDVTGAQTNPNPRYPQVYYNNKGILNPFSAGGWVPGGAEQQITTTVPVTTTTPEVTTTPTTTAGTTKPTTTAPHTTTTTTRPTTTTTKPTTTTTKPTTTTTKPTTTTSKPTTTEPPVTDPPEEPSEE